MADVGDIYPGTGERVVAKLPNPNGPGYWLQGEYGGVFAEGGAPFLGSYFSLDPVHRNDPNRRFSGIVAEGGGYRSLIAGQESSPGYKFQPTPTSQPTNSTPAQPSPTDVRRSGETGISAKGELASALAQYGLPASLADRLWNEEYVNKATPINTIVNVVLPETTEFKQRFPGLTTLKERRNRGEAVQLPSVGEYIQLEAALGSVMKDAGMPADFYNDPTDFAKWIGGSTSPKEVSDRIDFARNVAFSMPVETREELNRLYDIDQGELVAFVIDPDRALPAIQKRVQGAALGGVAKKIGFGLLTAQEAEQLAASNVTEGQAAERFGTLAQGSALFDELAGEGEDLGRTEQIGFAQGNTEATKAIERRRTSRAALFGGGGGAAGGGAGGTGLGSS